MNRVPEMSVLAVASFVMGAGFLLSAGCSKETPDKSAATTPPVAAPASAPSGDTKSLEESITAPGPKKLTAVSANGTTKVMEMGKSILAETDTYLVRADVPDSASSGASSQVKVYLTPKTGWKINQDYPTKLTVTPPSGVSVPKPVIGSKDAAKFSEKSAVFHVDFVADAAGAKAFAADFRFAVCTDATCDPKKATLAWNVNVK